MDCGLPGLSVLKQDSVCEIFAKLKKTASYILADYMFYNISTVNGILVL